MENIAKAINKVMEEVWGLWKSLTVWTGNNSYKWVSASEAYDTIRKSMIKNWLSIIPSWVSSKIKIDRWEEVDAWSKTTPKAMKTKQSVFTDVDTTYLLLHDSWEFTTVAWYGQWVDSQDKGAWKATTYALKNALINIFLIPTGDMYDTEDTHSKDIEVPQSTKPIIFSDFTDEIFKNFKEIEDYKDYFEAKWIIEQKYTLPLWMAKVVKLYYETKDTWVELKDDWTPPF